MKRWLSQGSVDALPALRRYARSLAGEADADDLVHEALLRAYDASSSFRQGENLTRWLLAIVHNCFVSGRRKRRTAQAGNEQLELMGASFTPPNQEHAVQLDQVNRLFTALPTDQRAVLHLVLVEGLSYQDAASVLNVPVGTVMSRLSRARSALRKPATAPRHLKLVNERSEDGR